MRRARCTLKVQGLDCPVEMEALRAALEAYQGVVSLGFDLIHGTMTVDYDVDTTAPERLVGRISEHAKMRASVVGEADVQDDWWPRYGRWLTTGASGIALLLGVLIDSLGGRVEIARVLYLLAIGLGGTELFPKAFRSLTGLKLDIHVLMSAAVAGALALGQWDEAATVAFLFSLSEAIEALSLDR
ncbi:heavy metal translocating P-type ATPase, partial [Singulisphaera rosea]